MSSLCIPAAGALSGLGECPGCGLERPDPFCWFCYIWQHHFFFVPLALAALIMQFFPPLTLCSWATWPASSKWHSVPKSAAGDSEVHVSSMASVTSLSKLWEAWCIKTTVQTKWSLEDNWRMEGGGGGHRDGCKPIGQSWWLIFIPLVSGQLFLTNKL